MSETRVAKMKLEDRQEPEAPEVPEKYRKEDGSIDAEAALAAAVAKDPNDEIQIPDEGETPPAEKPAEKPEEDAEAEETDDSTEETEFQLDESASVPIQEDGMPGTDEQRAAWEEAWTTNGKLEEEHYEQIREAIPNASDAMIDQYFRGIAAESANTARSVVDMLGGAESAQQIADWSSRGMSQAQRIKMNAALNSADPAVREEAAEGLRLRYEAANGSIGKRVGGGPAPSGKPPFRSRAERRAAMSDPLYKKSEAYRQEVADRSRNLFS